MRMILPRVRHLLRPALAITAALCLAPAVWVSALTAGQRTTAVAEVPVAPVALVFGAGVRPDGQLSPILADRVAAAVDLYTAGRVSHLLLSGDNSRPEYDEVTAMRRAAMAGGVPAAAITLDYAGFSTYESCYRARAIFGVTRAVLVTQAYHLPRAVYTCGALGIAATGLGVPDWSRYPYVMPRYAARELLAVGKALVEVHLTRPEPTFLGPFVGLPGSA